MRLKFIDPLLPTLVDKPPEGDDWIHEVKFDGYRSQIIIDEEGTGPAPKGMKRPATQWVKPGLIGRVKHLRGEADLRHASLGAMSKNSCIRNVSDRQRFVLTAGAVPSNSPAAGPAQKAGSTRRCREWGGGFLSSQGLAKPNLLPQL